jgi:hypothetical protein
MNTYNINNLEYTKEEIESNEELKLVLIKQLKLEHYRQRARERAKQNRITNRDKVNEYNKNYQKRRYNEDEAYKAARLEYQRKYNEKYKVENSLLPTLPNLTRGRPSIFKLNNDLTLSII